MSKNEDQKSKNKKAGDTKPEATGTSQAIEYSVLTNKQIPKAQIKEWLERDIKNVYILLAEILRTQELIDAFVNVYYKRYEELHKEKETKTPE